MIFIRGLTTFDWRYVQTFVYAVWKGLERPKLEASLDDVVTQTYGWPSD